MTFYIIWVAQLIRDTAELPCDSPYHDLSQLRQFKLWMHQKRAAPGCSLQFKRRSTFSSVWMEMQCLEEKKKVIHQYICEQGVRLSMCLKAKCKELCLTPYHLLRSNYSLVAIFFFLYFLSIIFFISCFKLWCSIDVHSSESAGLQSRRACISLVGEQTVLIYSGLLKTAETAPEML